MSKTPKWPFLLADLLLIGFAVFLVIWYGDTPDPAITAIATLLGVFGGVAGVAPFVMDHQQELRAQVDAERAAIRDLAAKIAQTGRDLDTSADAVRIAAGEASRAAKASEVLPARMQAAVTDLERRIANVNAENSERFAMVGEQLQTAVQQVLGGEQALARVVPLVDALQGEIAGLNMALARAEFDRRAEPKSELPSSNPADAFGPVFAKFDVLSSEVQGLRNHLDARSFAPSAIETGLADLSRLNGEQFERVLTRLSELATRLEALEVARASEAVGELREAPAPAAVSEPRAEPEVQVEAASVVAPVAQEAGPAPVVEDTPAPTASRKRKLPFSGMLAGSLLQAQTPAVERIIAAGRVPVSSQAEHQPSVVVVTAAEPASDMSVALVETSELGTPAVPAEASPEVSVSPSTEARSADPVAVSSAPVESPEPAPAATSEEVPAVVSAKPSTPPNRRSAPDPSLLREPEVAAAAELLHDPGILGRLAQLTSKPQVEREPALSLDLGDLPAKPKAPRFEPVEGSTVLVARAYIGIGNKLFVRGEGPGLSRERGVPMVFLEIGKWGWTCPEPYAPVQCILYRNDEQPDANGEVQLKGGETREVSPVFGAA